MTPGVYLFTNTLSRSDKYADLTAQFVIITKTGREHHLSSITHTVYDGMDMTGYGTLLLMSYYKDILDDCEGDLHLRCTLAFRWRDKEEEKPAGENEDDMWPFYHLQERGISALTEGMYDDDESEDDDSDGDEEGAAPDKCVALDEGVTLVISTEDQRKASGICDDFHASFILMNRSNSTVG